jgi:hypothetical protein
MERISLLGLTLNSGYTLFARLISWIVGILLWYPRVAVVEACPRILERNWRIGSHFGPFELQIK